MVDEGVGMDRALARISRNWTSWGRKDALYAVLVDDRHKGNRWEPEEFFATGRSEIQEALDGVGRLGVPVRRGRALDFGCGVGRLTQALGNHFDSCVGVDIAPPMLERARAFNRHGGQCTYVLNEAPHLRQFDDGEFDFVYSNIVLQHMPPKLSTGYMREFIRVLAPGGVAVFSCPSGPGSSAAPMERLTASAKEAARTVANAAGRIVSAVPLPKMEMHCVAQEVVEELIAGAGASLVDAEVVPWGAPKWVTVRYTVTKPAAAGAQAPPTEV